MVHERQRGCAGALGQGRAVHRTPLCCCRGGGGAAVVHQRQHGRARPPKAKGVGIWDGNGSRAYLDSVGLHHRCAGVAHRPLRQPADGGMRRALTRQPAHERRPAGLRRLCGAAHTATSCACSQTRRVYPDKVGHWVAAATPDAQWWGTSHARSASWHPRRELPRPQGAASCLPTEQGLCDSAG